MDKQEELTQLSAQLTRGAEEFLPAGELLEKLKSGKPLRIKTGFDPTSPDLHLGHTVLMQKMRHFQECGHIVIFLIGDFTAMIGDPSGRDSTRPQLSRAEIVENAKTYTQQAFKILDKDKTEVRYNSEWFDGMDAAGLIRLAAQSTVARMLERNDFSKRYQQNQSISIHEFLYPLVQGYDSLMLNADVELGGTDQKFNLLVGRDLQRQAGQSGQCILTMPLLEGLDGEKKMSKSFGNHIGVDEPANEMYGKVMSISDELMWRYYELLSEISITTLNEYRQCCADGENPMGYKKQLAAEITCRFHGSTAATAAGEYFNRHVSGGALPDDIPEITIEHAGEIPPLFYLLKQANLAASTTEGRRLIEQGAVRVDGSVQKDPKHQLPSNQSIVIQSGKRRFARITLSSNTP